MEKEYHDATLGYHFKVDSRVLFQCGCGSVHIYVRGVTDTIMWKGMGDVSRVWYVRCALDHMIWRAQLE